MCPGWRRWPGSGGCWSRTRRARFGLPAFKVLGASWATYRVLCERLGGEPAWSTLDDLAAVVAERLGPLRLVAATDGNHGRAVARMAKLLGLAVDDPRARGHGRRPHRRHRLRGRRGRRAPGDLRRRRRRSRPRWPTTARWSSPTPRGPATRTSPRWVIEGYSTIFAEIDGQLAGGGQPPIDVAVVPLGVGALGAAAGANLRAGREPGDGPLLVGVEPDTAACVAAAVEAGHVVEVPGAPPVDHGRAQLRAGVDAGPAHRGRHVRRVRRHRRRPLPRGHPGPGRRRARRRRDRRRRPRRACWPWSTSTGTRCRSRPRPRSCCWPPRASPTRPTSSGSSAARPPVHVSVRLDRVGDQPSTSGRYWSGWRWRAKSNTVVLYDTVSSRSQAATATSSPSARALGDDRARRVDDARPADVVDALLDPGLGHADHERAVLVGARLHDQVVVEVAEPVVLGRRRVVDRRVVPDADQLDALEAEHPVRLGPAAVVADQHPDPAAEGVERREPEVAPLEVALLQVLERPPRLVLAVPGQVDLAVAADLVAVGRRPAPRC